MSSSFGDPLGPSRREIATMSREALEGKLLSSAMMAGRLLVALARIEAGVSDPSLYATGVIDDLGLRGVVDGGGG